MRRIHIAIIALAGLTSAAVAGNEAGEYDAITGGSPFQTMAKVYARMALNNEFCGVHNYPFLHT